MQVTKRRTICFVVSDFLDDDFEHAMVTANRKHDVIAVLVTDPNELEVMTRELTVEGIIAIREGASPRHIVERLEAYLEPELRVGSKARLDRAA